MQGKLHLIVFKGKEPLREHILMFEDLKKLLEFVKFIEWLNKYGLFRQFHISYATEYGNDLDDKPLIKPRDPSNDQRHS